MPNMREIRERIGSIQQILKITNAMYLMSSSKLKKARKSLACPAPYFYKLRTPGSSTSTDVKTSPKISVKRDISSSQAIRDSAEATTIIY